MFRSMKIVRLSLLRLNLLGAVLLFGLGCAGGAAAETLLESYSKPMLAIPLMKKAEFEEITSLREEVPFGQDALAYKVRLPKKWKKAKEDKPDESFSDAKILTDIAHYYSPPAEERGIFQVQTVNLAYQMTAEQWFLQYLIAYSYTAQGIKTYNDQRTEGLFVTVEGDTTYIVRAVVEINGKRAVFAQYKTPIDYWEGNKQVQAQAIDSFRLTHPVQEFVEEMKLYRFLDIAEMNYPASWELRAAPVKSVEALGLELFNVGVPDREDIDNKSLNGKIDVQLSADMEVGHYQQQMKAFKDQFAKAGIVIKDKIKTDKSINLDGQAQNVIFEVYHAMPAQATHLDYELWVTSFQSNGYNYFVALLTPSRYQDFFIWARNTETYKLVAKTLKPFESFQEE